MRDPPILVSKADPVYELSHYAGPLHQAFACRFPSFLCKSPCCRGIRSLCNLNFSGGKSLKLRCFITTHNELQIRELVVYQEQEERAEVD